MAFDGLLMHKLIEEINLKIQGGRIDKIHQPEKDELTLKIRSGGINFSFFISVDASIPYFSLTEERRENPDNPPMFCMLMRKHLTNGKINRFYQIRHERIAILEILSKNELGDLELKNIIIEIMGKHSNIIVTREDGVIIDSIKRISPDMSRIRSVLPGLRYEQIQSNKVPLSGNWQEHLMTLPSEMPILKALYSTIEGFSPTIAKYLLTQSEIFHDLKRAELTQDHLITLTNQIKKIETLLKTSNHCGYIYYDSHNIMQDFYFIPDLHEAFEYKTFESLAHATEKFYTERNLALKIHQRTADLKKSILIKRDRAKSKLQKLRLELDSAENADHYKVAGELILANIYQIQKGTNKIELLNYYMDPPEPVTIDLDVRLDASQNAQLYFKKYAKSKTALEELAVQIDATQWDIQYLDSILSQLELSEDSKTIQEIRQELAEQGIIKSRQYKGRKKDSKKQGYRQFRSSDGYAIFVGKNNMQNDYLTTKIASNKDIWLHTKIIPGSHVIIRTEGQEPPERTLEEAGMLAAYYSNARASENVPVDYTFVRYVTKPNGAKPGMVIYTHNKTLYITPDEAALKTLISKED